MSWCRRTRSKEPLRGELWLGLDLGLDLGLGLVLVQADQVEGAVER